MKIAAVQLDIGLGNVEANLERIVNRFHQSRSHGAELTIFPECALTGYCFDSHDECKEFAQPIPGPATERLAAECAQHGGHLVLGMLESDGASIFNVAVLVGPSGVIGTYRKVHMPFVGVDRFITYGDRPFAVHSVSNVKIGMHICYDGGFPEVPRLLTLLGADLLVLPTNWPPGAECMAAHAVNARAMENAVYFAAVNRVGKERGFRFIGGSRICDPSGNTLAQASELDEEILYAEIDPRLSRQKRIVRVADKHIIDRLGDRRPEMYGLLAEPHDIPTSRESH